MRKIILALLFLLMIFSLFSCSFIGIGADIKNVKIDYRESNLYSKQDMDSAISIILNEFKKWDGCTLYTISYTDDAGSKNNIAYCNSLKESANFDECIIFKSSFHTSKHGNDGFNPDEDYEGWSWYLARSNNGSWQLLTWGYG